MSKTDKLNDLFKKWESKYVFKHFIQDGIVDESQYEKQRIHILFVLRDKNDKEVTDATEATDLEPLKDLRKTLLVDKQGHVEGWRTWNNIARWTQTILDQSPYLHDVSLAKRIEELHRVAVMNLKKECGSSSSDLNEIEDATKEQSDLILKEIKICDPDVIIGCGLGGDRSNAALLKKYVFRDNVSDSGSMKSKNDKDRSWNYYYTAINKRKVPVIEFRHPSTRCSHEKSEWLCNDMAELCDILLVK
ncbi:hypothetical protein [Aminicella lysinilytica]|nr:hypothetical protein [Aminicella lysinilytica]